MGLLATALACLAISPGCGGPAVEAPPSVAQFALFYERSGGLKATPRRLVIRPGRNATAAVDTGADSRAVFFRVGVRRVRSLQAALERADFHAIGPPGPNPGVCADCFSYAIRYRGHEVAFSQVTVPKGLQPVVDQLESTIEDHLPFH
jgi:hypothetical protein